MKFEEFVANESMRNAWVREQDVLIYVRRSIPSRGTDFDIANMNSYKPGGGSLTRFLDKYEPQYSFYIENVLNPRLLPYFKKRGYEVVDLINMSMKKIPKESA